MSFKIKKLDFKPSLNGVDFGDKKLNNYFRSFAYRNTRDNLSATYVAYLTDLRIIGYYTLSNCHIPIHAIPLSQRGNLPSKLSALLLGRLAVDTAFRKQGVGRDLLLDAMSVSLEIAGMVGCYGIYVEPYKDVIEFYKKYGFSELEDNGDPPALFISISRIRNLFPVSLD